MLRYGSWLRNRCHLIANLIPRIMQKISLPATFPRKNSLLQSKLMPSPNAFHRPPPPSLPRPNRRCPLLLFPSRCCRLQSHEHSLNPLVIYAALTSPMPFSPPLRFHAPFARSRMAHPEPQMGCEESALPRFSPRPTGISRAVAHLATGVLKHHNHLLST